MRTVILARYYLPPPAWKPKGKPYASTFLMRPEEALARGALGIVPGSEQEIAEPETEDERVAAQVNYQSAGRDSVKPPQ